jgi:hypothetical protein
MRILILSTTMADGKLVKAGTEQDISVADAEILIEVGKARLVTQTKPEVVQTQKRKGRKRGAQ